MSRTPRRRRQSEPGSSTASLAAILLGILVGGFGIGALLSALAHRAAAPEAVATSTPFFGAGSPVADAPATTAPASAAPASAAPATIAASPPPPVVTRAPLPTRAPRPTAPPTHATTPRPRTTAPPRPPTHAPRTVPPPTVAPRTRPPVPTAAPTATPSPEPTPRPVPPSPDVVPTVAPAPSRATVALEADSPQSRAAASVVRGYLGALMRGDLTSAAAALGGVPGGPGIDLKETEIVDRSARITALHATRSPNGGSDVDVDLVSGKGTFYITFSVAPDGRITQHTWIKP